MCGVWGFAFQCVATVGATVLACEKWPIRAPLRPLDIYIYVFGSQSCATRLIFAGSAPLRPRPWPRLAPSGVRRGARGLGLTPAPCAAAPVAFAAIRAAMLRRRDTAFSPCDVSHRASDEPRRRMSLSSALAPSSLASPSIRRVFVRSFCARRRPVSELNPRQMCRDAIRRYMTLIDPNCFANNFVRTIISFRRA